MIKVPFSLKSLQSKRVVKYDFNVCFNVSLTAQVLWIWCGASVNESCLSDLFGMCNQIWLSVIPSYLSTAGLVNYLCPC